MSTFRDVDPERLEFLRALLQSGEWVSGRYIQSAVHRRFGDPTYKPEMDELRMDPGVDFEDRTEGTQHYFHYRLRPPALVLFPK